MKKGKLIVKFNGQQVVKTSTDDDLFFFDFNSSDKNRAIHGSEVTFIVKPPPPSNPTEGNQMQANNRPLKKFIEILDVKYPKLFARVGFLKRNRDQIMFVSLDKKYSDMLVRDIKPEVYEGIRDQSQLETYSHVVRTQIESKFVERYFFKAEFMSWSPFEMAPYARIIENLGPIYDLDNYKKIVMLNQGISQEMYPFNALTQAKTIEETFDSILEEQLKSRKDIQDELVFTIDGAGAQALDDGLSFSEISPNTYRVGIHIADVASLVIPGTPLDSEALQRAATTYVLRSFHMPMLPRELNAGKCSLHEDQPRLAITLSIDVNTDGLFDFSSARYDMTVLKNTVRLSYESADLLIRQKDDAKLILPEKHIGVELELRKKIQALHSIAAKRRDFRKQFEGSAVENEAEGESESGVIVEEMMLITSSMLPYFKD